MSEYICKKCGAYAAQSASACPECGEAFVFAGKHKNIIDSLTCDCLIHRYAGSDLLEPAQIVKIAKTNIQVAVKLKDLAKPIAVPKSEVFALDGDIYSSINDLRDQRRATMDRFDELIGQYWRRLGPLPN